MIGPCETLPRLGLIPYSPQTLAGVRIHPPPSLPRAHRARPAAAARAPPPPPPPPPPGGPPGPPPPRPPRRWNRPRASRGPRGSGPEPRLRSPYNTGDRTPAYWSFPNEWFRLPAFSSLHGRPQNRPDR